MIISVKVAKKIFSSRWGYGANGRLVQCSSCGQKWTQYPNQPKDKNLKKKYLRIKIILINQK